MGRFARVDSIETLTEFRVSLCKLAEAVKVGLSEAEAEIQRTASWLQRDQQTYWKAQARKRAELLTRAKIALYRKQQQKTPLGGTYSCVDEKKALATAKRRYEESQQKLENTRRWIRKLEREVALYKGEISGVDRAVDLDLPNALAQLDNMVAALESYASLAAPQNKRAMADASVSNAAAAEDQTVSMGRDAPPPDVSPKSYPSLRTKTPPQHVLDEPPVVEPGFRWSSGSRIDESQRQAVADLDVERLPVAADDKVVIATGVWNQLRIYLERVAPSSQGHCVWYVGFADDTEVARYEAVCAADLLALRPDWTEILELPKGTLVVLDGNTIESVLTLDSCDLWGIK